MSFIALAAAAGLAIALVAGPVGCFVVWRRMAYFGDSLAHAALLGIGVGLMLDLHLSFAVLAVCLLSVPLILLLTNSQHVADDTALGILSHASLAIGITSVSLAAGGSIDLSSFLFGDILSLSETEVAVVIGMCAAVGIVLAKLWRQLVYVTIHFELASVEGLPSRRLEIILMLLIAVLVAVGMQVVGALLIGSLLIIPAAAAGLLAGNPERMAWVASSFASAAIIGGLAMSWWLDTPAGPSAVVVATSIFAVAKVVGYIRN
jgi:zinc transport system permease protein